MPRRRASKKRLRFPSGGDVEPEVTITGTPRQSTTVTGPDGKQT